MSADASIKFDISLDLGKIETAVNSASDKVRAELNEAFTSSAVKCEKTCDQMASAFKTVDAASDYTRQKIDSILGNAEKSAKSKASSIAWIYRKQGMSQSEAMKKAWSEIERTSSSASGSVRRDIQRIGEQSNQTSSILHNSLVATMKKVAVTMAAAFSIKKAFDFGKQCIELGSDLQEVQNVVDVTFRTMNKQVNAFAREAASSFGLSDTMAKRFSGTFGAMAKAFGFNEKAAYEMSTTLTGLAGDIASFYNISQDEAYTKLKSVFTGETESIRDLGVVMTQTALDSYALANGYGKVTAKMSEAEKVALRYQFVQEQLSAAAGDFARTSDSWANQVRVLGLQFDSLKASIGQGLINALTPVIKVINTIIAKLITLADYFRAFTAALFGNSGAESAAGAIAESMETAAGSAGVAASNMGKTANAADKTKKALGATGIDELNILKAPEEASSSDGSTGSGGVSIPSMEMGAITVPDVDTSGVEQAAERIKSVLNGFKNFLEEHKGAILATIGGLVAGIATYFSVSKWSALVAEVVKALSGFKAGLVAAFSGISPFALGVAAVVGLVVAGIIDLWNTSETFRDNMKACWELVSSAFATGWNLIWNLGLKPLGEALAKLGKTLYKFYESSGLKKLFEIVLTVGAQVVSFITSVLVTAVSGTLAVITGAIAVLINFLTDIVESVIWVGENWQTIWTTVRDFFANTLDKINTALNNALASMLSAWDNFWAAVGSVLRSILEWILQFIVSVFTSISNTISMVIANVRTCISNGMAAARDGIKTALGEIKSAWEDTWNGLKSKTVEIFNRIWATIKSIINSIIGGIERMINSFVTGINKVIGAVNEVADKIPGIDAEFIPKVSKVSLPRLAQGGFVRANTPQLAMIGDNRHYGEIVAPEDKMQEMVNRAVAMASGSHMSDQYLMIMIELLKEIIALIEAMDLTVKIDIRDIKKKLTELDKRSGYTLKTT